MMEATIQEIKKLFPEYENEPNLKIKKEKEIRIGELIGRLIKLLRKNGKKGFELIQWIDKNLPFDSKKAKGFMNFFDLSGRI